MGQSDLQRGFIYSLFSLALAGQALADDGCDKFAWSVTEERGLFGCRREALGKFRHDADLCTDERIRTEAGT